MAIIVDAIPDDVTRRVLLEPIHQTLSQRRITALAEPTEVDVLGALPIYAATHDAMAQGDLSGAALQAWRFPITQGLRAVAACEIPINGEAPLVLDLGYFVRSTATALATARAEAALADNHYTARLLRVPAWYLVALWLVGPSDRFMPLPPAPGFLAAKRIFTTDELVGEAAAFRPFGSERAEWVEPPGRKSG